MKNNINPKFRPVRGDEYDVLIEIRDSLLLAVYAERFNTDRCGDLYEELLRVEAELAAI